MQTIKGNYKVVKAVVEQAVKVQRPIFIWGGPGIGKSSLARDLAIELNYKLRDERLSQLDPVDLRGMPVIDREAKITTFFPPDFLPKESDGKTILFFDELNQANRLVQAAALQLMLERRCGSYELPKDCSIIAAGNRATDNAFVQQMNAALENRLLHIEMEATMDTWIPWARTKGVTDEVIDFLQFKTELFNKYTGEPAFPTPRSWEHASQMIAGVKDEALSRIMMSAAVGIGAATEFYAWMKVYRSIDVDAILTKGEIPDIASKDASVKYALVLNISGQVRNNKEKGKESNLAKFLKVVPTEFQVLFFKNITVQKIQKLLLNKDMEEFVKIINKILD